MEPNLNLQFSKSKNNKEEEIDLIEIFSFLLRNKFLILNITFLSIVVASIYSLTLKKVWEGQFQIVLNSNSQTDNINPTLSKLLAANKKNNSLNTQVEILQSPSVLMPIYDLVNKKNNVDSKSYLPFNMWKYNLDIELQNGTSILNISYRDTNKDTILPALKKMSSIYLIMRPLRIYYALSPCNF